MANFITNILEIRAQGEDLTRILKHIQRDGDVYGSIDFNKLIPMPDGLDLTDGSITDDAILAYVSHLRNEILAHPARPGDVHDIKQYVDAAATVLKSSFGIKEKHYLSKEEIAASAERYDKSSEDFVALGKQYLDNQLSYGAPTWYKWCYKNWGTKWNVEDGSKLRDDNTLHFETAWSAPLPILNALSKKFPTVAFFHQWADENLGYNVGQLTLLNGGIIQKNIPKEGSKDAYDLSFQIQDLSPEDMCLRYSAKEGTYVYDESLEVDWEKCEPEKPHVDNLISQAQEKTLPGADKLKALPAKDEPVR